MSLTEEPTVTHSTDEAILNDIKAAWLPPALLPGNAFAAAKVRELTTFIDWHLEIVARQLYPKAFFGAAPSSEGNLARMIASAYEAASRRRVSPSAFGPLWAASRNVRA